MCLKKIISNINCLWSETKSYGMIFAYKHVKRFLCNTCSRVLQYTILFFTKCKPLKNIIIIESHNDFDCNGGAFYNYLIKHSWNVKYKIVWLIKNKHDNQQRQMPANVKVYNIYSPSILKNYYITRAKFFTADDQITRKVRNDQIVVFFDHGSFSLKNAKNFLNLPETIDYYLTASSNFDPIYCRERSVPYPNPKLIHLGYPMHDVFFRKTPSELEKITNKKFDKVILWMPTFRKGGGKERNDSNAEYPYGIPLVQNQEEFSILEDVLRNLNILLIIKIHPMQDKETIKLLMGCATGNIVILTGDTVKQLNVDNYCLLKDADALISDYSSVVYSYILLDRPVGFVLYDAKDMKYGFCVDNPEFFLTGSHIYKLKDMVNFIQDVKNNKDEYKEERRKLCDWLYEYKDGLSCERIVNFLKM